MCCAAASATSSSEARGQGHEKDRAMAPLTKYVFIQNETFYLKKVLDKCLREFADSTAGVNIQSVAQGKRTVLQSALDLLNMYGPLYFQWNLRNYLWRKIQAKVVNDILGS